jgi:hypothetical protein
MNNYYKKFYIFGLEKVFIRKGLLIVNFTIRIFILIIVILSFSTIVLASGDVQCSFIESSTCPGGTTKLLGVRNDTGGYNNAHAENNTLNNYPYSLCCNSTNASITITNSCSDQVVVKLSDNTDAHIETSENSNYAVDACLSSSWQKVGCSYQSSSCSTGTCLLSMASSEGDNSTNAHLGDCSHYDLKVCCGFENNAPESPTLIYPANGNNTVFERRPAFDWSDSTDSDGDSVDYNFNLTCNSCSVSCPDITSSALGSSTFTPTSDICTDQVYYWNVEACDTYGLCNQSTTFNFTIASVAEVIFLSNSTSFGSLAPGSTNDTSDDSPAPLILRNTGNVLVNLSTNATNIFESSSLGSTNYQFAVDEEEAGSYTAGCSQESFTAFTASLKTLACDFKHADSQDEVEVEIRLQVPTDEPASDKQSNITISYISAE